VHISAFLTVSLLTLSFVGFTHRGAGALVWACVEQGGGALVRELIRQVCPTAAQRL
jgi:hypothetical protein